MKLKLITFLMIGLFFTPLLAHADNLVRINENAKIQKSEEYEEVVVLNGSAQINGRIVGNVVVLRGNVEMGNTAYIGGDVICLAGTITAGPGAMVIGSKVEIGGQIGCRSLPFFSISKVLFFGFLFKLVSAIILLLLSIFIIIMWPNQIRYAAEEASIDLVKSSLVGVFAISILIPLCIGFAITFFGLPISFALFVFLMVAGWFGIATISYLIGLKVSEKFSPLIAILIGFAILKFIHFVPFIGSILYFIAILPGLGAILLTRFGTNKPWLGSGRAKLPEVN